MVETLQAQMALEHAAEQQRKDLARASVPREVASLLNPLISDMNAHGTSADVADVIAAIGYDISSAIEGGDDPVLALHLFKLTNVLAAALRYEAAVALRGMH